MTEKTDIPSREDMERDLVRYDKQKLISLCLKLYDASEAMRQAIGAVEDQNQEQRREINQLQLRLDILTRLPRWKLFLKRF